MSIVMTGGGTGGHLAIIRAVKEQLGASRNAQIMKDLHSKSHQNSSLIYIGSTNGQDRQWFEEDKDFAATYFLETRGVVNQGVMGKIASIGMLIKATGQTIRLLRKHRASVVFSVGGYSAAATAFAAKLLRIPLVIHEQNAVEGSLNRILKPFAHTFISSYDPASPIRDYPVKQVFFETARVRERVQTLLVMGGSQGAVALNDWVLHLAPRLQERGIRILHQAGERNIEAVKEACAALGIEAEVFGFSDRIPELMVQADLAIARAGASTLWELVANGLPALFVPFPYATGDHQYHNAKFLADQEMGWVMRQEALEDATLLALLDQDLRPISQRLIAAARPDGAREIAELLSTF